MTRNEFMDLVYDELSNDSDNYRANRIIDAADEYANEAERKKGECSEEMPDGVELISRQAVIDAISECGICLRKIYDLPHIVTKFKYRTSKED